MNDAHQDEILSWINRQGLDGATESELLCGFCEECRKHGMDLSSAVVVIDTLHPVYEGRAFRWVHGETQEPLVQEYGSSSEGEGAENWRKSVFYELFHSGGSEKRCRLGAGDERGFETLDELYAEGFTDYLALINRFTGSGVIGEMDCIYSYWTSRGETGFRDEDIGALRRLFEHLSLALKCASLTRIAGTLAGVYLGHDAGQRVLSGRITRGVTERIHSVLWFSDLKGYTTISDAAAPDEIIPFLNEYAELVISSIHWAGGDVLKLIGDGTLAIFRADDPAEACRAALRAESRVRIKVAELNERRKSEGKPATSVYLGLHIGDVLYGNIGSDERLDFTVVGPAVNEVSRIASMCRSVDRALLVSTEFAQASHPDDRANFVSVGRFALRGVSRAEDLYTLDPGLPPRADAAIS